MEELTSLCLASNLEVTLTTPGQPQKLLSWELKEQLKLFSEVKMSKKGRELIQLVSSAKTGVFYVTKKNKRISKEKLRLKKYDNKIKKHVMFNETKLR